MITTSSILTIFLFAIPEFQTMDRLRHIDRNDILADVVSHNTNDHYRVTDGNFPIGPRPTANALLISSTHEYTHGVNGILRQKFSINGKKINGFYLLDNRFVTIEESNLNITDVLPTIPLSIRYNSYNGINSRQMLKDWNDRCLYLTDEFMAHTHAAMYRKQKGFADRDDCIKFAFEHGLYSMCHLKLAQDKYERYDELKVLLEWNFNRCFDTFNGEVGCTELIRKFVNAEDVRELREFIRCEFGEVFYERLTKIGS